MSIAVYKSIATDGWDIPKQGLFDLNYRLHPLLPVNMLYFAVPKAGCTTVLAILHGAAYRLADNRMALYRIRGDMERVHDRHHSPVPTVDELAPTLVARLFNPKETFIFTIVRDPSSRALAGYLDKVKDGTGYFYDLVRVAAHKAPGAEISFETFLEILTDQRPSEMDIHWRAQTALLRPDAVKYSLIGRFEHLGRALTYIQRQLPFQLRIPTPSPHKRTSATKKLQQYLTPRAAHLLERIYALDYEVLKYPSPHEHLAHSKA